MHHANKRNRLALNTTQYTKDVVGNSKCECWSKCERGNAPLSVLRRI